MKIQHITYDAARPENVIKRIKGYIYDRIRGPWEDTQDYDLEPLLWPAIVSTPKEPVSPRTSRSGVARVPDYSKWERGVSRQDRYGLMPIDSSGRARRGNTDEQSRYRPTKNVRSALDLHNAPLRPFLKRKNKFWRRPIQSAVDSEKNIAIDLSNRSAPQKTPNTEKLLPPLPTNEEVGYDFSISELRCSIGVPQRDTHTKAPSTSSKIGLYLGTSADLLDATRRDLIRSAERVFSGFELPSRLSQSRCVDSEDESDSDDSFFCVGEKPRPSTAELQDSRRLSGASAARDLWIDGLRKECRLCRRKCIAGIRGLCRGCETDFQRPNTMIAQAE